MALSSDLFCRIERTQIIGYYRLDVCQPSKVNLRSLRAPRGREVKWIPEGRSGLPGGRKTLPGFPVTVSEEERMHTPARPVVPTPRLLFGVRNLSCPS